MKPGKTYVSTFAASWSIAAQRKVLAGLGQEYCDNLGRAALRRKRPEDATSRAEMLKPTSRHDGECIYVASLACIARTDKEWLMVLAGLAGRGATLIDMETAQEFPPLPVTTELAAAQMAFRRSLDRATRGPGRKRGFEVAKERVEADIKRCIDALEPKWGDPAFSTARLLAETKRANGKPITYNTVKKHLGRRPKAVEYFEAEQKRAAIRAAKAAQQEQTDAN